MSLNLNRSWKARLGAVVALGFLHSNVFFAYAGEANFWGERRQAARRLGMNRSQATGGGATSSSANAAAYQMLAQLPRAAPAPIGLSQTSSVGAGLSMPTAGLGEALSGVGDRPSSGAPAWLSQAILPYGTIREIHLSKKPNAPLIIHIQDAHGIEEAQKNMADFSSAWRRRKGRSTWHPTGTGRTPNPPGRWRSIS